MAETQYQALVEPLEPSLFTVPPMDQWFVPTNQPQFPKKRFTANLGYYDKPIESADFVTIPDFICGPDEPPRRKKRLPDLTWFAFMPPDRLFAASIARYVTASVRLSGATYLHEYPLNNFRATTDPGLNDDAAAGYSIGSVWINRTSRAIFQCVSAAPGAADWDQTN